METTERLTFEKQVRRWPGASRTLTPKGRDMTRHWYASGETVIDGRSHGTLVHAFNDRGERDDWVGRGNRATGPHRRAIGAREAERLAVRGGGLFVEYAGRAPEFFFQRFGPDWAAGIDWDYEDLGSGRRWMFAL